MKFALRDDDLNYFYSPSMIEENIGDIWDICPISMSVIPFVIGNWEENTRRLETFEPGNVSEDLVRLILDDTKIYDIAANQELVTYITEKMAERRVYLTLHGVHHRNSDPILPEFKNNYAIGAEFFTSQDLTLKVIQAKFYLEKTFGQDFEVFTPPQNLYNYTGFKAIENSGLNICGYLPSVRNHISESIKILGSSNYLKLLFHKLVNRNNSKIPFGGYMSCGRSKIIEHWALQPGSDINQLYSDFDKIYNAGFDFVLSTHSYGFKNKMTDSESLMGEVLRDFLVYASHKKDIQFVTLNKLFE